jgi:hypothetical protein
MVSWSPSKPSGRTPGECDLICEFGACGGITNPFTPGTGGVVLAGGATIGCVLVEPCGILEAIALGGVLLGAADIVHQVEQSQTTGSVVDCWNQYAKDLKACSDKYPPGPARQECFARAKAQLDFCRGNIKGPVQ